MNTLERRKCLNKVVQFAEQLLSTREDLGSSHAQRGHFVNAVKTKITKRPGCTM